MDRTGVLALFSSLKDTFLNFQNLQIQAIARIDDLNESITRTQQLQQTQYETQMRAQQAQHEAALRAQHQVVELLQKVASNPPAPPHNVEAKITGSKLTNRDLVGIDHVVMELDELFTLLLQRMDICTVPSIYDFDPHAEFAAYVGEIEALHSKSVLVNAENSNETGLESVQSSTERLLLKLFKVPKFSVSKKRGDIAYDATLHGETISGEADFVVLWNDHVLLTWEDKNTGKDLNLCLAQPTIETKVMLKRYRKLRAPPRYLVTVLYNGRSIAFIIGVKTDGFEEHYSYFISYPVEIKDNFNLVVKFFGLVHFIMNNIIDELSRGGTSTKCERSVNAGSGAGRGAGRGAGGGNGSGGSSRGSGNPRGGGSNDREGADG